MTKTVLIAVSLLMVIGGPVPAQETPPPILDMHIHARGVGGFGPPPVAVCVPVDPWPAWDPARPYGEAYAELFQRTCDDPMTSPGTDSGLISETLEVMQRRNVYGVLSGSASRVAEWVAAAPRRFFAGLEISLAREGGGIGPDSLRTLHQAGRLDVLGEVFNQYAGIAPDDERMEPYWTAAEELDLPVAIHVGTSFPGVRYLGSKEYLARLHDPLTLEQALIEHPRVRVYLMHAGFPMLEELLTLLYNHPQVYVGVGAWIVFHPRAEVDRFLRGMVEAGFSNRIMYGSDAQIWPEGIERGIEVIEEAPYLTEAQKRDILYGNAARFLRLSAEQMARQRAGR